MAIGDFGVYAVDPQIFSKCKQVPYFWAHFGWRHGYLVEAIPDKRRYGYLVRDNIAKVKGKYGASQANLIFDSLNYLYERKELTRYDTTGNGTLDQGELTWEEEVITRNQSKPFKAVFTTADSTLSNNNMNIIRLQEEIVPQFIDPNSYFMSSQLHTMDWKTLILMFYPWFNKSAYIKIIDPYFNPNDHNQFWEFLNQVMKTLLDNLLLFNAHKPSYHLTVEFHCVFNQTPCWGYDRIAKLRKKMTFNDIILFRDNIYRGFNDYMSKKQKWKNFKNCSFKFFIWEKVPSIHHDRYIIFDKVGNYSEKVAIQFTGGIGKTKGDRTILFLSEDDAKRIYGDYDISSNLTHITFEYEYTNGNLQLRFL